MHFGCERIERVMSSGSTDDTSQLLFVAMVWGLVSFTVLSVSMTDRCV
jgi:hypothetical protein